MNRLLPHKIPRYVFAVPVQGVSRRKNKAFDSLVLAHLFEISINSDPPIDLKSPDWKGHPLLDGLDKSGGKLSHCPTVDLDHIPTRDNILCRKLLEDDPR